MTIHTRLKNKIKVIMEVNGFWTMSIHGHKLQKVGVPDLLCIKNGLVTWIEFKIGKDKLSAIQSVIINELVKVGCNVLIMYLNNDILNIKKIDKDIQDLGNIQNVWGKTFNNDFWRILENTGSPGSI